MFRAQRLGRLRLAVIVAFFVVVAGVAPTAPARAPSSASLNTAPVSGMHPVVVPAQAIVAWPPSSSLVVSEIVTGGASASDEFVEIYNAGPASASLAGLELVYVTASGSTITRKQAWTELALEPGQHLLLANSAGAHTVAADGLYSGGFAASGGSLVLRTSGGEVVDSLSWGEAASSFVEGAAGPAPAPGSSLERKPGGAAGNGADTNDNLADTFVQPSPVAQGLAAPPVPAHTPQLPATPEPTASADPTATPEPVPTEQPTPEPVPSEQPTPRQTHEPAPTAPPTGEPQPTIDPAPTPGPTTEPEPAPTTSPTADPRPTAAPPAAIGDVRGLPLGTSASVRGWLTTPTGLTESGSGAFVQDATGGIALYLAAADWPSLATGSEVVASGVLETRFSLLTLRLASAAAISVVGEPVPQMPVPVLTGHVDESVEGRLVSVEGVVSDGISHLAGGYSTALDDGSGGLRVVVAAAAGIPESVLARGTSVRLTGVVGQRDTSGTGGGGYRLHPRSVADVEPSGGPSPSSPPTPAPTPSASPDGTPSPSASAAPSPTPAASGSPAPRPTDEIIPIDVARQAAIGERVTVRGVVTVAPGLILGQHVTVIQDDSAGICVKLPPGVDANVVPGRVVEASGVLVAPYGNLELRVAPMDVAIVGTAGQPAPRALDVVELGEATEGLLARVTATIRRMDSGAAGSVTLIVEDRSGEGRVFLHAGLGLARDDLSTGQRISVTGIVGDRLGLYRLWPRSAADIAYLPVDDEQPGRSPSPTGSPPPGDDAAQRVISIAHALTRAGQSATIIGTVSSPPGLLDADAHRVTVQDASGAILTRLPADGRRPTVGQRLRLTGQVGTYYGAPQLTVSSPVAVLGRKSPLQAERISSAPVAPALEWRLVTVSGTIESVRRDGEAWRSELKVGGGGGIPIIGLARSGLVSTLLATGRQATITGIVRRAYPTASDQRLGVVPRSAADIKLGAAPAEPSLPAVAPVGGEEPAGPGKSELRAPAATVRVGPPARSLSELAQREGLSVAVGGRVERVDALRLVIDDGTATAAVRLSGEAAPLALLVVPGMLVNAEGTVERNASGALEIHVADAGGIVYTVSPVVATRSLRGLPGARTQSSPATHSVEPAEPAGSTTPWLAGALLLVAAAIALALAALDGRMLVRARAVIMRGPRGDEHAAPDLTLR